MSENIDQEELEYIISHDLQEPIRMISSYVKLLERKYDGVLDGDAKEYIRYTVDGSNRLKLMLDDLLKYSRINPENSKKTRCELKDIIESATKILKSKYGDSGFKIIYDGDTLPEIVADKNQIIQLFLNIFDNALKFNMNSDKRIHITFSNDQNYLKVCISDNGIGIDNQYHDMIFKIFKKLHNHSEYTGSGIGLASCRKIVEIHNGKIWFESGSGDGTKFYFTLSY